MRTLTFLAGAVLFANASAFAAEITTGIYTLQQKSNGRYLDAYQSHGNDFGAVTREDQDNKTQEWFIKNEGNGIYRIQQLSKGLALDSDVTDDDANRAVVRPKNGSNAQKWKISEAEGARTITQVSSGRRLDAHEHDGEDFAAVTRGVQNNATQQWIIKPSANSKAFLERFREGAKCHRWKCGEFRDEEYSKKQRASALAAAACNAGPYDIELVFRRKYAGDWDSVHRHTIKPDECYRWGDYIAGPTIMGRRNSEIRINDPHGSVYHMMRSFDERVPLAGSPEGDLYWEESDF